MGRARQSQTQGDGDQGGGRFATGRDALAYRKAANDNRLSLRGWLERIAALALLIGLAALLALKFAG